MTASQFVLVYDTAAAKLTDVREFDDVQAAADAVPELERRHRRDATIHVVMLSGESLDTTKATHGTYFRDSSEIVESLAGTATA